MDDIAFIKSLINKMLKIKISDGRVLVGSLLCTDKGENLIIGSAAEYWGDQNTGDARMLGLVMIPGKHIVSVAADMMDPEVKNSLSKYQKTV